MTTTKRDIAEQMSERMEIDPEVALNATETLLGVLADALIDGDYWELRNFGVFKLKQRSTRLGRNIHTGESIPVASYRDIVFKPGKTMLKQAALATTFARPKPRKTST